MANRPARRDARWHRWRRAVGAIGVALVVIGAAGVHWTAWRMTAAAGVELVQQADPVPGTR